MLLLLSVAGLLAARPLPFRQSAFKAGPDGLPPGWQVWSARPEIAPRTFVDDLIGRSGHGSLAISGNSNLAAYGGWEYTVAGVEPGKWYRFAAYYRAERLSCESRQVVARLDWTNEKGNSAGPADFPYLTGKDGEWTRIAMDAPAPENAVAVKIQLFLSNAPSATVWWDDVSLEEIPQPAPRKVRVAAVNFRPQKTHSAQENLEQFARVIDSSVPPGADLIVLGEGITVVGTGKHYADVAEPIPGPSTARLGELARRRKSYLVAGIYERDGVAVYNTAVLIGRDGNLAGKYRKVNLPREEVEGGLTPGNDYPVFRTDFGKLGIMVCWDYEYADAARALVLGGAELIAMPIWGGNPAVVKARAIENHVFIAASGYDYPTQILDPVGEELAAASANETAAVATIDLGRRYVETFLGEMRGRFRKEVRLDLSGPGLSGCTR
jgi:predicted amidohydrolase